MDISRRSLFAAAGFGTAARLLAARSSLSDVKLGVTDWNLRQSGKIEALALAKTLGFAGVEVSLGRRPAADSLPLADADVQARYLAEARRLEMGIAGTCLDILHVNYLKNDPLGRKWVADGIPITRTLKAGVMLLPFFGKGAITETAEQDYVADVLKELAPEAEKAGVVLGLENTISAEANARILERVRSKAVRVYYDVGNSTNAGFDPVAEIRFLGKERICQIHLKDRGYIGEGRIDFPAVIRAIKDIGYTGWANLETSAPSGSVEEDMKRNLAAVRRFIQAEEKA